MNVANSIAFTFIYIYNYLNIFWTVYLPEIEKKMQENIIKVKIYDHRLCARGISAGDKPAQTRISEYYILAL